MLCKGVTICIRNTQQADCLKFIQLVQLSAVIYRLAIVVAGANIKAILYL